MDVLTSFQDVLVEASFETPSPLITVLTCKRCGRKSADVAKVPSAWDGWRVSEPCVCHECIAKGEA